MGTALRIIMNTIPILIQVTKLDFEITIGFMARPSSHVGDRREYSTGVFFARHSRLWRMSKSWIVIAILTILGGSLVLFELWLSIQLDEAERKTPPVAQPMTLQALRHQSHRNGQYGFVENPRQASGCVRDGSRIRIRDDTGLEGESVGDPKLLTVTPSGGSSGISARAPFANVRFWLMSQFWTMFTGGPKLFTRSPRRSDC